ncbi:MAG TPA: M48 family metalloprotease [Pyrinomonadaceae bacterium]|jgi:Zn-dependent protease with chaperone function
MYEGLGICLALAALLAVNTLATLLASGCWHIVKSRARRWPASVRASFIFALRFIPPACAFIFVMALLIPAYLAHEPRTTSEAISFKLALVALLSASGIALALWRGFVSWRATRGLLADWLRQAEPVSLRGLSIPAYSIPHKFPVIAIVGLLRPRLFISARVLDALAEEELSAALAHECGHLAARDNLKRVLMRVCRDVLTIVPCGRSLDRAWTSNAEAAADEYAARLGPKAALSLASALIEIARMIPAGAKPSMPVGAFLLGDESEGVIWRVRRLLELASGEHLPGEEKSGLLSGLTVWTWRAISCALFALTVLMMTNPHTLASVHLAIERLVSALN